MRPRPEPEPNDSEAVPEVIDQREPTLLADDGEPE
jgi:hypothetical protein